MDEVTQRINCQRTVTTTNLRVGIVHSNNGSTRPPRLQTLNRGNFISTTLVRRRSLHVPSTQRRLFLHNTPVTNSIQRGHLRAQPIRVSLLCNVVFRGGYFRFGFLAFASCKVRYRRNTLQTFTTFRHNVTSDRRSNGIRPINRQRPCQQRVLHGTSNLRRRAQYRAIRQASDPRDGPLARVRQSRLFYYAFRRNPPYPLPNGGLLPNDDHDRRQHGNLNNVTIQPNYQNRGVSA